MEVFAETSFLFALYCEQDNSSEAVDLMESMPPGFDKGLWADSRVGPVGRVKPVRRKAAGLCAGTIEVFGEAAFLQKVGFEACELAGE
jgi:hypothetical protein